MISRAIFLWPPTLSRADPVASDGSHLLPIPQVANPASWPSIPQQANPALKITSLHWPPLQQRANPALTTSLHWLPLQQRAYPAVTTATFHCPPISLPANPAISPAFHVYTELNKLENILKYRFTNKLFLLYAVRHPSSVLLWMRASRCSRKWRWIRAVATPYQPEESRLFLVKRVPRRKKTSPTILQPPYSIDNAVFKKKFANVTYIFCLIFFALKIYIIEVICLSIQPIKEKLIGAKYVWKWQNVSLVWSLKRHISMIF